MPVVGLGAMCCDLSFPPAIGSGTAREQANSVRRDSLRPGDTMDTTRIPDYSGPGTDVSEK